MTRPGLKLRFGDPVASLGGRVGSHRWFRVFGGCNEPEAHRIVPTPPPRSPTRTPRTQFCFPIQCSFIFRWFFFSTILLFLSSPIMFNVISYLLKISCSPSPLTSLCVLLLTNCAAAGVAPGGPVPLTGGTRLVVASILLPMVYTSLPSALVRPRSLSSCYHHDLSAASFLWPCA